MNIDKITLDTIVDMFLHCKLSHHYIIFIKDYPNKEKVVKYIEPQLKESEDIFINYSYSCFTVNHLKTGSTLKIMPAKTNRRGLRSFLSLYDDSCPKEIIDNIVRPMCTNLISFNINNILEVENDNFNG